MVYIFFSLKQWSGNAFLKKKKKKKNQVFYLIVKSLYLSQSQDVYRAMKIYVSTFILFASNHSKKWALLLFPLFKGRNKL